jgi:hypothetical protein
MILVGTGSVPTVPELDPQPQRVAISQNEGFVRLDSVNCKDCKFSNISFAYGGGLFNCDQCQLSNVKQLYLDGAALNTLRALMLFRVLPTPKTGPETNPNQPGVRIAITKPSTLKFANFPVR